MRRGNVVALSGALLALVAGLGLPWQTFQVAGVTAVAAEVPVSGQLVVALAVLLGVTSFLGLRTPRAPRVTSLASVGLMLALTALSCALLAPALGTVGLELLPGEAIHMGLGHQLALWGLGLVLVGLIVVLASEPRPDPDRPQLRVAVMWNGTVFREEVLLEGDVFVLGPDHRADFIVGDVPPLRLFEVDRRGAATLTVAPGLAGEVTLKHQPRALSQLLGPDAVAAAVTLGRGDWGLLEVGGVEVFFQMVRPERVPPRRIAFRFDEVVAGAVAVSFLLQVGAVLLALFLWQETPVRVVTEPRRLPLIVEAVHGAAAGDPEDTGSTSAPEGAPVTRP